MKSRHAKSKFHRLLPALVAVLAVGLPGTIASAMAHTGSSITIRNNSQREIRHLYVAVGDPNNWSSDQLNGSNVPAGSSYVLNDVSCGAAAVRLIAEDQNGCFMYYNASCDANQTWEITDNTVVDCDG